MKAIFIFPLLLLSGVQTFTVTHNRAFSRLPKTARHLAIDPSSIQDHVQNALTSFSLADAADTAASVAKTASDAVSSVSDAASGAVATTTDAATDAAANNGWFGFLTGPIESFLNILHIGVAMALGQNSWGVSIVVLTLLIKALTFPLTKSQLESTTKMQAMQPEIKKLQAQYQSNPEVMNQKVAEFYQANEINPLAGCIPSLVQIPVFIGLYRAVLTLAKENKLDEPFLWLPSLQGPTYGADPAHGSDWILKGWTNGVPSLGWEHTIAFLILPAALVISQFVSMELMQAKTTDQTQQQTNVFLKFLPLLIGWFSLNVPSALCVYWVTNNIVTTATSLYIRNALKVEPVVSPGATIAASLEPPGATVFSPPRAKPAGFGSSSSSSTSSASTDGVNPITAIDAEIVKDKDQQAKKDVSEDISNNESESSAKKRGSKKRKRRKT